MGVAVVGPLRVLWSGEPLAGRKRVAYKYRRWVDQWSNRLDSVRSLPFAVRYAAVMAIIGEMAEAFSGGPEAVYAGTLPAVAPGTNKSNPDQYAFGGDGHILLNMVIYAGAGFVIGLILRYMGRGELSMIVLAVTGFVILRQFLFILEELMGDVKALVNM